MPNFSVGKEIVVESDGRTLNVRHVEAGLLEGVVVRVSGAPEVVPVIVRVQSSCILSESFGAVDCDCKGQLDAAIELVAMEGGFVVYLLEEGRGAGLRAKLEAISIQQSQGVDTAAAFSRLGIESDPRDYAEASQVLRYLIDDRPVVLLTNNPTKASLIRENGVNVIGTRRLVVVKNELMREYLDEKARVLGHVIS